MFGGGRRSYWMMMISQLQQHHRALLVDDIRKLLMATIFPVVTQGTEWYAGIGPHSQHQSSNCSSSRYVSYCSRSAYTPKINLDPASSTTENLEALAPLIKSIQDTDSEQLYLRSLDNFVEEKEREIEEICQENYEVCRVNSAFGQVLNDLQSTPGLCLFCFNSSHNPSRDRASKTADWWARWPNGRCRKGVGWKSRSVTLLESTNIFSKQKRALLEQKKVARNIDDAIETLQTCLRLLDLVHRIDEMVREGKYWGALRVRFVCLLVDTRWPIY